MLGNMWQCKEFVCEHACDSVVPAKWCHITYSMNDHGEVAGNVSASSNIMVSWFKLVTKISFLSPILFFVGSSEKLCIKHTAHHFIWTQGKYQRSDSRCVTSCDGWFHLVHSGWEGFTAFCFQKGKSMCIKINFRYFCYALMCKFILFAQLNNLLTNESN